MKQNFFMLAIRALALTACTGSVSAMENTAPIVRPTILPKPPVDHLIKREKEEKPAPARQ